MHQKSSWPSLPYEEWNETLETIHLWTQVAGKIRLALTPWTNHSWHVPLYVTPNGLTTSTMFDGKIPLDIEFDFRNHKLGFRSGEGGVRTLDLRPQTVADFYAEVLTTLSDLGHTISISEVPCEIPEPIPFSRDTVHNAYDKNAVRDFIDIVNQSARVFSEFRSKFLGKCSPVHFFWGSFDLAVTRFSGREAPPHPGGIPGLADWVTREAYSHEVYSCGYWPGSAKSPAAFYAYAYPVPEGLGDVKVLPEEAFWSAEMGEFFLPYSVVEESDNPDSTLMQFLDTSYDAVARLANWDRKRLETPAGFPKSA